MLGTSGRAQLLSSCSVTAPTAVLTLSAALAGQSSEAWTQRCPYRHHVKPASPELQDTAVLHSKTKTGLALRVSQL